MGKDWLALLCILTCVCCACSEQKVTKRIFNNSPCRNLKDTILWVSEEESALIVGKGNDPFQKCELTLGLRSDPKQEKSRLRVEFEFLYIHDCGVELQINESFNSMFSPASSNQVMMKSNCNTKMPGVLHAQPKNFVRILLYKQDRYLEAYNFRLSVSMIESLPEVGPAFHTLVIAGFVVVIFVCLASSLFFKYLAHVTQSWHEMSVGDAMDRAICIYNSQEPLQEEQDHVFLQPGQRGDVSHQARHRQREPEIAFVHRDGRVERFRPRTTSSSEQLGPQGARSESENALPVVARFQEPQRVRSQIGASSTKESVPNVSARNKKPDRGETSSVAGFDLPPSYEEALELPVAATGASHCNGSSSHTASVVSRDSNEAVPLDESRIRSDGLHASDTVDYMNVAIGDGVGTSASNMEEVGVSQNNSDLPVPSTGTGPKNET